MTKLIVILGITGNQGASVADVFLREHGWKLRGITRDLKKASSNSWVAKGIEMVEADVDDTESLDRAFEGASAIFAVTDFWGPMYDPFSYGKLRSGQTINEYCCELEIKRGRNIADAVARISNLERFIFSSLPNIKTIAEGKYRHVYHFDAKAEVVTYIKDHLPELYAKTSELQLGEFAINWQVWRLRRPNKQPDGSYVFLVPGDINRSITIVVPRRDTGYFVRALVTLPPGKTLLGYGSILNHLEYVSLWTRALGVPNGGARQVTVEEAAAYEGGPHGIELAETVASVMELDLTSPNLLHPSQIPPEIGCPITSIEEYLRDEDFSAMLDI